MTTLKVGIASYAEMKARTIAVARGERRFAPGEPKVWFTSTESFAKVLSAGNRDLLRVIAEKAPASLDELSRITGKAKSNLSRTLKTMAGYGLVRLERGERGRIAPKVTMTVSNSTCRLLGRGRRGKFAGRAPPALQALPTRQRLDRLNPIHRIPLPRLLRFALNEACFL